MLTTLVHGTPTQTPPLLIAHGLFGSARNWNVIAKRLSDERQVIAVDMRNHGHSPRSDSQSYPDMAQDLAEVIDAYGGQMDVLGHSMGGKTAMTLALQYPEKVHRLVVADIAPVTYTHSHSHLIAAMRAVDLTSVKRRSDAEEQLAAQGVSPNLQSFFTQSLDISSKTWLLNLDTLDAQMQSILGFPELGTHFSGPTLFLSGGTSDYVQREHRDTIKSLFPNAHFAKIPGTGHWLHAEKPREFEASVRSYLHI